MFEGLKVVYLEDEPIVAFDTGEHLESLGFDEVVVAYRLAKAEAAANEKNFDLAILDINVDDGQTSLELGADLAAKGTAVVFASGTGSACAALEKRGFVFLHKPYSLELLTEKLRDAVANT